MRQCVRFRTAHQVVARAPNYANYFELSVKAESHRS